MKVLSVKMPDGSKWGVPVSIIARHRAAVYAKEFGGDIERSLAEDTNPYFAENSYAIEDWAANNMNWSDVSGDAVLISGCIVDWQEGWINGEKEPIEYEANIESTVAQALPDTLPSFVTEGSIKAKIKNVSYHVFEGTTLTHCTITLENGYTVTGESACVRPESFNKVVGEEWAFKDAFEKLWKLEGYLLKQQLFEQVDGQLSPELAISNIKRDNSLLFAEKFLEFNENIVVHDEAVNTLQIELEEMANNIIAVNHKI